MSVSSNSADKNRQLHANESKLILSYTQHFLDAIEVAFKTDFKQLYLLLSPVFILYLSKYPNSTTTFYFSIKVLHIRVVPEIFVVTQG